MLQKITLTELLKNKKELSYLEQYEYVSGLIETGKLRPVRRAGVNGKRPALPLAYWKVSDKKDYSILMEELKFIISPRIATDYYRKHPEVYEEEREWVLALSRYLDSFTTKISLNERSFQIWNREKFLQKEQGKQVLKHCGLTLKDLNLYQTSEPLAYYSVSREVPQTILIIENKDTFYSMRKYLIDSGTKRDGKILGIDVKTLVYGAGKGILRSIEDFSFCVEPYMNHSDNRYLYFGDLDYEGIGIYERLAELFKTAHCLEPFVEGYQCMLKKAEHCEKLPATKEGQNKNLTGHFDSFFKASDLSKMQKILLAGRYIPQEILNITDLERKI